MRIEKLARTQRSLPLQNSLRLFGQSRINRARLSLLRFFGCHSVAQGSAQSLQFTAPGKLLQSAVQCRQRLRHLSGVGQRARGGELFSNVFLLFDSAPLCFGQHFQFDKTAFLRELLQTFIRPRHCRRVVFLNQGGLNLPAHFLRFRPAFFLLARRCGHFRNRLQFVRSRVQRLSRLERGKRCSQIAGGDLITRLVE